MQSFNQGINKLDASRVYSESDLRAPEVLEFKFSLKLLRSDLKDIEIDQKSSTRCPKKV